MIGAADRNDPAEGRLQVVPATGGALVDVLPGLEGHVADFDWLDDTTLVFVADVGTATEIGRVSVDGTSRSKLFDSEALVVTQLAAVRSGESSRLQLIAESAAHPPELYTLALTDGAPAGGPRRRTASNPWLARVRLAPQEVVRWKARDGKELEGILIRPLDEKPGQRYPLVMIVHGGPESALPQRLAHLVLADGSGRGGARDRGLLSELSRQHRPWRRVLEVGHGDAAGKEFDDLVDGVDHLVKIGPGRSRTKVGITGGSYGGYATAWGATYYSDRFAAGVMFVGISDNVSKVGTTDIPHEMFWCTIASGCGRTGTTSSSAARSSTLVERNARRLLILHGKDDPRVHPSQSLELYRHLKVRGQAPVRLVLYPGEGHGNRKSAGALRLQPPHWCSGWSTTCRAPAARRRLRRRATSTMRRGCLGPRRVRGREGRRRHEHAEPPARREVRRDTEERRRVGVPRPLRRPATGGDGTSPNSLAPTRANRAWFLRLGREPCWRRRRTGSTARGPRPSSRAAISRTEVRSSLRCGSLDRARFDSSALQTKAAASF